MPELPIRPEALDAAAKAFTRDYGTHHDHTRAAIAAFCKAEGLTVEVFPRGAHSLVDEQRLVGPWRDVEEAKR